MAGEGLGVKHRLRGPRPEGLPWRHPHPALRGACQELGLCRAVDPVWVQVGAGQSPSHSLTTGPGTQLTGRGFCVLMAVWPDIKDSA